MEHINLPSLFVLSGVGFFFLLLMPRSIQAIFGQLLGGLGAIFVLSLILLLTGR